MDDWEYSMNDCPKCGETMRKADCPNCEEGYSDHDCGEDCCCCLDPEPNVICDWCGGWGFNEWCANCGYDAHEVAREEAAP